jgi:cytochrome P450 family 9
MCISVHTDGDLLVLEMKDFYTRYTNDVIATAAFGIGVDSLKHPTNEFYMMGQDLTYMGWLRAFRWLAYVTMTKLMQVSTFLNTILICSLLF